jgi:hypothetical protein
MLLLLEPSLLRVVLAPSKSALTRAAAAFATALDRREDADESGGACVSLSFFFDNDFEEGFLAEAFRGFRVAFRFISSDDVACKADAEVFRGFRFAFRLISSEDVA